MARPGFARLGTAEDVVDGRRSARHDLVAVTNALIAEFAGSLPASAVISQVSQAREQLLAAGVRAGLAVAVDSMARTRLRGLQPAHGTVR